MPRRKIKTFDVTAEAFLDLIKIFTNDIPENATIIKIIELNRNPYVLSAPDTIRFYIESEEYPEVNEGAIPEHFAPALSEHICLEKMKLKHA